MALTSSQFLGRAGSVPLPAESCSRRSLDATSPCAARSRRSSVDIRAGRGDHILASTVLTTRVREGVNLEVGRSVDFNEQRRRLEHSWNSEDLAAAETLEEQERAECGDGSEDEPSVDARSRLEQRWQQSLSNEATTSSGKATGHRRQLGSLASSVRRNRHNFRHRPRSVGHLQTAWRRRQSLKPVQSELADQQFLAKLSTSAMGVLPSHENLLLGNGLLSREAEVELGRIVQLGIQTQEAIAEMQKTADHVLSQEEQEAAVGVPIESIRLRLSNRHDAQQLLIKFNTRLLAKVAKVFVGRGMELEDLMGEGIAGLERAIVRFDPGKGYRFSTYAYMWIRQAMSKSIAEHARLVRLPGHVFEMVGRIEKARVLLSRRQDQTVTDEQIASALGLSAEKVALYTQASKAPASLDSMVHTTMPGQEDIFMRELLPDSAPTADEELVEEDSQRLMREDIDSVLSGLSLRERNVLRYRYGLHTDAISLADLSAAYGLSKERLRQIGEVALAKLQLRQASNGTVKTNGRIRNVPVLRPEMYGSP